MTESNESKTAYPYDTEKMLNLLVDGIHDYAIVLLDNSGNIVRWNTGAQMLTGYSASEIVGRHISAVFHKQDNPKDYIDEILKIAAEERVFTKNVSQVRKNGQVILASVTITPIYDDDQGHLTAFTYVAKDITLQTENERKIRESEERLRLLIESVSDYAIFILDPQGHIVSWNSGAERIKGYREQEIIGKHFSIFYPDELKKSGHPDFELKHAREFGRYVEEGIRIRKDGSSFEACVTITAILDTQGQLRGFTKVTQDITQRKTIERNLQRTTAELELRVKERTEQLQRAKEIAEAANRAKSTFLANMSHEIRTPMSAVLGYSEILVQDNLSQDEKIECREAIARNSKTLLTIINDILDLSKIEAGYLKVENDDVDVSELMSEIAAVANLQAQEKGLTFSIEAHGPIPSTIYVDPVRLKQILLNLIGNAIKFTSKGYVRVSLNECFKNSKCFLKFSIEDTGPGICPSYWDKTFTPFNQADASLTRKYGGTGLGLTLSRHLARAMGGDVELTHSEVGKGSIFTASLPYNAKQTLLFSNAFTDKCGARISHKAQKVPDLSGLHVLLVEDVYDNQVLIRKFLTNAGAKVECAINGQEGIEILSRLNVDVVLMDLSMPIMDGYEATQHLRAAGYSKPIIALTAHAMRYETKRSKEAGFDDHITKPIDQQKLYNTLRRLVPQPIN